ncbi:hypothetical protein CMV_013108 [Castanea mollissima]|uniref:Leucine-rich repeat-containing N-terminal plant-type domain-containing protein n=1 Tax=Castanea mollissima TaxID=60419 RepID=A0A8J4VIJ1_9ROSI|nr:hypothetical protein CMV_013108 [Castanea mollissima]
MGASQSHKFNFSFGMNQPSDSCLALGLKPLLSRANNLQFTILSFFKAESNVFCNEKEKQALLSLKRGLTDPENVLSSWSDHEDCCRWEGVHCDNKTGQVTELSVNSAGGELDTLAILNFVMAQRIGYWKSFAAATLANGRHLAKRFKKKDIRF